MRAGVLDEAPLGFVHPLLRTAVYREMAAAERAEGHGRAARLLAEAHASPARVAEHLLATAPAGDAWVVEQLQSRGLGGHGEGWAGVGATYLRRAVAEPPSPEVGGGMCWSSVRPSSAPASRAGTTTSKRRSRRLATTRPERRPRFCSRDALRYHHGLAEAIRVCDGVAARLDSRDAEAQLTLEAMAVLCGLLYDPTAPSVASRARALLVEAAGRAVPRQALSVAAFAAALANQPADQVADLARRAVTAGSRPLPEPGDPPWLQTRC